LSTGLRALGIACLFITISTLHAIELPRVKMENGASQLIVLPRNISETTRYGGTLTSIAFLFDFGPDCSPQ
jgi:hypothetical protein